MASATDGQFDEAILSYIDAARPVQVSLQQVLTQVAGYSLMLMINDKPASRPEGAILIAQAAAKDASEQLQLLAIPASAAHHHHHLLQASEATRWAFVAAQQCAAPEASEGERETLVRALQTASEHLRTTARLLPGFETVDFGQACCAIHAQAAANPQAT